jgi:tagatose 6-phosphate kinase
VIVTVTLNPALDITYTVPELKPGTTHRPRVTAQAGGKGVNVARTLHALGRETVAVLPLGGFDGEAVRTELETAGVPHQVIPISRATRRTVTVVETGAPDGLATGFNEAGPELTAEEWADICAAVGSLLETATLDASAVLVLSGKLPPGLADAAYAELIALADSIGVPTILDTEGPALLAGLSARPAVVKPNVHELLDATGVPHPGQAATELLRRGARAVVASHGPDGLTAHTADGTWSVRPPRIGGGNPTGAGDAAVAALAIGLADGTPWSETLVDAAALSAATVLTDRAGVFDAEAYRKFKAAVASTAATTTSTVTTSSAARIATTSMAASATNSTAEDTATSAATNDNATAAPPPAAPPPAAPPDAAPPPAALPSSAPQDTAPQDTTRSDTWQTDTTLPSSALPDAMSPSPAPQDTTRSDTWQTGTVPPGSALSDAAPPDAALPSSSPPDTTPPSPTSSKAP